MNPKQSNQGRLHVHKTYTNQAIKIPIHVVLTWQVLIQPKRS